MSGVWVIFPYLGAIRLSTLLAFVATVVIVFWYRRSWLLALLAGMGWVSAFEIVWQGVATIEGQFTALHLFYLAFSLSGWVVAAYVAGVRPHPVLLLAWALVFLGWIAYGFHPNGYRYLAPFSIGQEVFNVLTKDGLAAIYVIGALAPFRYWQFARATKARIHLVTR